MMMSSVFTQKTRLTISDETRAYKEVMQLFKNRMDKVSAEFDKLMAQYEFQKSRKRK